MRRESARGQGHHFVFIGKFGTAGQLPLATEETLCLDGDLGMMRLRLGAKLQ